MSQQNSDNTVKSTIDKEFNQLTAIRDILFGQNMAKYAEEFKQIRTSIAENQEVAASSTSSKHEDLLDKIHQLEERLSAQINQNQQELLAAIDQLQANKQDRKSLGALLIAMGKQIQQ